LFPTLTCSSLSCVPLGIRDRLSSHAGHRISIGPAWRVEESWYLPLTGRNPRHNSPDLHLPQAIESPPGESNPRLGDDRGQRTSTAMTVRRFAPGPRLWSAHRCVAVNLRIDSLASRLPIRYSSPLPRSAWLSTPGPLSETRTVSGDLRSSGPACDAHPAGQWVRLLGPIRLDDRML
jgi:hypothetical protein